MDPGVRQITRVMMLKELTCIQKKFDRTMMENLIGPWLKTISDLPSVGLVLFGQQPKEYPCH